VASSLLKSGSSGVLDVREAPDTCRLDNLVLGVDTCVV